MAAVYTPGEPTWEYNELNRLASQGKLSGINPAILSAFSQWESQYETAGPGVNSSGYGGYFGLSTTSIYPGQSAPLGRQLLLTNSPASFDTQAEVASAEFADLLKANNENVYGAAMQYDGGSPAESSYITSVAQKFGPAQAGRGPGAGPSAPQPVGSSAAGGVTPGLNFTLGSLTSFVFDVVFVLAGLAMILAGFVVIARASGHDVTLGLPGSSSSRSSSSSSPSRAAGGAREAEEAAALA